MLDSGVDRLYENKGILKFGMDDSTWDWKDTAYCAMADISIRDGIWRCNNCEWILEDGESCNCDEQDLERLHEWREVFDYVRDREMLSDEAVQEALIKEGFDYSFDVNSQWFYPRMVEMIEVLERLVMSETHEERLLSLTMALHLRHVNGQLIDDHYAQAVGMSEEALDQIQQKGIAEFYDIDEWLTHPLEKLDTHFMRYYWEK